MSSNYLGAISYLISKIYIFYSKAFLRPILQNKKIIFKFKNSLNLVLGAKIKQHRFLNAFKFIELKLLKDL